MDDSVGMMGEPILPITNTQKNLQEKISDLLKYRKEKNEEKKEQERRLKDNERKRLFIDHLGGSGAFEYTFENFPRKNITAYQDAVKFDPATQNFYLLGPSYVGKTHLSTAMAHKFFDRSLFVYVSSIRTFKKTLQQLEAEYKFAEEKKYVDYFVNADVLVIHELGRGKISDLVQETLWEILERRIHAKRNGLIITSNFTLQEIEADYGKSIFERIKNICQVIRFPPRSTEVI